MNHLLRTLTESQVKPATDLRLLLSTVKEARRQVAENKLTDPFYDSLEGLLQDLKTITVDNRDAEAFLKPVSRAEWPDYYEVISNPMDFQTMLKKVKQRSYRSKREFKDDLDLIWSNCYVYNSTENHPLRRCVDRLKLKAEQLLKHITDRKDRHDPAIPSDLPSPSGLRPKLNGLNGHINGRSSHTRSPSINLTPTPLTRSSLNNRRNVAFADSLAIVRTPEGMASFYDLDKEIGSSNPKSTLAHRLRELAPAVEAPSDSEDDTAMAIDGPVLLTGDKRKLNGSSDHRPRKRARFTSQYPTPLLDERDDLSQLWWGAVQSDQLLSNGLPGIPFGTSSSTSHHKKLKRKKQKRPKLMPQSPQNPKSLLSMMNTNIKTMRRVRHTHNKFAALTAATTAPEEEDGAEGGAGGLFAPTAGPSSSQVGMKARQSTPVPGYGAGDDDVVDERIDEHPWMLGRRKDIASSRLGGIEIGEDNAADCLHWATDKILEHSGFQGSSKVARDVLADVASEYFSNVGRMMRFLVDTFGKTMTPEEIILHTLFESGTSKVQDLDRFISDDIERYGTRLGEVEKKLVSAYRETTAGELLEDEGLFEEESDGENGALAIGEFADVLGEDYLGLRELGIADEIGFSGLTIPRRLLKGRKGQNKPMASKPTEPPPPFPPPPPFVPFTVSLVDDQIGLLKNFYQEKFWQAHSKQVPATQVASSLPGPSMLSGPSLPPPLPSDSLQSAAIPATSSTDLKPIPPPTPMISPDFTLLDDLPNPAQVKMSPIGQIIKSGASAAAAKKKAAKPQVPPAGGGNGTADGGIPPAYPPSTSATVLGVTNGNTPGSQDAKKKKSTSGVGSGNGKKKKDGSGGSGTTPTPAPVFGGQGPSLPAVVTASA
ncbi:hypothetical protein CPB83DRAFT_860781 [Crepidotus variabilis]|uniref:Bromo domain-containing protein n=1 Tax=Crepidotus variabilis TaxID=179855 RepID=A0A9P6E9D8_9AGAR|nr:hypothetical protein CPB83DRAFT_860781 [Crepidotus variabilis]